MSNLVIRLLLLFTLITGQAMACRMLGVLALPGHTLGYPDGGDALNAILQDELEAFRTQGGSGPWPYNNLDGWGMTTFARTLETDIVATTRSDLEAFYDEGFYDSTEVLLGHDTVRVLMGHLRQTSSGATGIANPHPFVFSDETGKTFSFGHNGDVDKIALRELIGEAWLTEHPPQTYGGGDWDAEGWYDVVDSELYFFWILKNIQELGDVETGIIQALTALENLLPIHMKNFLFSDGRDLYAYRSSPANDIHYFDGALEGDTPWYMQGINHRAIMSTPPISGVAASIPWVALDNRTLLVLRADGSTGLIPITVNSVDDLQPRSLQPQAIAYPNPFNGETSIQTPVADPGEYRLEIFDLSGEIRYSKAKWAGKSGKLEYVWSGVDKSNQALPSGQYIYRLIGPSLNESGKLLLLK